MRAAIIQRRLFSYSETLTAWAEQVADVMVRRAANADYDVWKETGKKLSKATLDVLRSEDRGATYQRLKAQQVTLIKSLPIEASKKVVEWTQTGLVEGDRWEVIADRIKNELGGVTESRAKCIARTETARSRSNFTQARAQAIGSTHYIWHTVGDGAVRHDHVILDGTVQAWNSPPIVDRRTGVRSAPGCVYNCRCFAEPLWTDVNNARTKYGDAKPQWRTMPNGEHALIDPNSGEVKGGLGGQKNLNTKTIKHNGKSIEIDPKTGEVVSGSDPAHIGRKWSEVRAEIEEKAAKEKARKIAEWEASKSSLSSDLSFSELSHTIVHKNSAKLAVKLAMEKLGARQEFETKTGEPFSFFVNTESKKEALKHISEPFVKDGEAINTAKRKIFAIEKLPVIIGKGSSTEWRTQADHHADLEFKTFYKTLEFEGKAETFLADFARPKECIQENRMHSVTAGSVRGAKVKAEKLGIKIKHGDAVDGGVFLYGIRLLR